MIDRLPTGLWWREENCAGTRNAQN